MVDAIQNKPSVTVNQTSQSNEVEDEKFDAKKGIKNDKAGAPVSQNPVNNVPVLVAPRMDVATMMLMITALQTKNTEQAIKQGEVVLEGQQKEIKDQAEHRMKELQTYFENLEKGASQSGSKMGIFGFIGRFFKNLFTGNWQGLKETMVDFGKNIGTILADVGKLIGAALAIVLAATASVASYGAATPMLALAIAGAVALVAGMIITDPVVVNAIIETLPEDQKMGAMIGLMVAGMVLQITGGIMMAVANPKALVDATIRTVSNVILAVSGAVSGASTIVNGVQEHNASMHRADAQENQAKMDERAADIAKLQALINRNTEDMKALMEILATMMSSTGQMLSNVASGYIAVAKA